MSLSTSHAPTPQVSVTAQAIPLGEVKIVRKCWSAPIDVRAFGASHHLELAFAPSPQAQARFVDHWGPRRFEPIGRLFFIPAEQRVHARSHCERQTSVVCNFTPEAIQRWCEGSFAWTDRRLQRTLDIGSTRLRSLLLAIGEEMRTPGFASATLLELMAGQAAIELFRYLSGVEEKSQVGGLSSARLRLIDDRLAAPIAPPSLSELAALCNLSVRQLTRAFRQSRGRSLGSYIAECRLERAKRLLAEGRSVKAVALDSGFHSPSNFTTAFSRSTGETPRQYRDRAVRRA